MSSLLQQHCTRRSAIRTGTATGLTLLAGTILDSSINAAQNQPVAVETPPPATPPLFDSQIEPTGPTIASKAADLNFDVANIYRFVAEDVRYEPYAGVLRGAEGTLWSLSGNAADKALLLSALFDAALVEHRFVTGKLDEAGVSALHELLQPGSDVLRENQVRAALDGFAPRPAGILSPPQPTPATEPGLSDADRKVLEDIRASAAQTLTTATSLFATQAEIITRALDDAGIILPPLPAATVPDLEIDRHIWVQVADGPVWIDYAPAIGRDPGVGVLPSPTEFLNDIPDDLYHNLTLKIVAEEMRGGTAVRRDAVTVQTRSANIVDAPIAVAVLPPGSLAATGASIISGISGDVTLIPIISGKGQNFEASTPVVFGASGGALDALGNSGNQQGPNDGETIALWLTIDLQSPGAEPESFERVLVDRIGYEGRQAETIDYSTIEPVTMVDAFGGGNTIPQLLTASLVHIASSRLPFSYTLNEFNRASEPEVLSLFGPAMLSLRQNLNMEMELDTGSWSFIASPHITMTSITLDEPADTATATISLDLVRHPATLLQVATGNATDDATHPRVRAGILDQVAEQLLLQSGSTGESNGTINAGMVFSAANDQNIPTAVITSLDELAKLDASPETRSRLEKAMALGWIAVIPASPVTLGDRMLSAWWLIDPKTGETRDEMEDGGGYASVKSPASPFRAEIVEDTELNQMATEVQPWYRQMGKYVGCVLAFASIIIGVGGIIAGANAGGNLGGLGAAGGAVGVANGVNNANKKIPNGGCRS